MTAVQGGIGGLAAARALQQVGITVVVYEGDSNCFVDSPPANAAKGQDSPERNSALPRNKLGYGLTLNYCNGKGPLHSLGLLERCVAQDTTSLFHWMFDGKGNILGYYGRHFSGSQSSRQPHTPAVSTSAAASDSDKSKNELRFSRGSLRIPRAALRRMLFESLEDRSLVVQFDKALVGLTETVDGVQLRFADGTQAHCDVCVGADGIRSLVRCHRDRAWNCLPHKKSGLDSATSSAVADPAPTLVPDLDPLPAAHRAMLLGMMASNRELGLQYLRVTVLIGISKYSPLQTGPRGGRGVGPGGLDLDLVTEGGFYTVDGTNRLFVMPYQQHAGGSAPGMASEQLTMWQLSFLEPSEEAALRYKYPTDDRQAAVGGQVVGDSYLRFQCERYLEEARKRLYGDSASSLPPHVGVIAALLEETPLEQVWCNLLYDRPQHLALWPGRVDLPAAASNPAFLCTEQARNMDVTATGGRIVTTAAVTPAVVPAASTSASASASASVSVVAGSRVTVAGDAAHCMSMFKGQGANQALHDGPLLARCLQGIEQERGMLGADSAEFRVKLITMIRNYEREMTFRANRHVEASREAAAFMHSSRVLTHDAALYGVQGVTTNTRVSFGQIKARAKGKTAKEGATAGAGPGMGSFLMDLTERLITHLQKGGRGAQAEAMESQSAARASSMLFREPFALIQEKGGDLEAHRATSSVDIEHAAAVRALFAGSSAPGADSAEADRGGVDACGSDPFDGVFRVLLSQFYQHLHAGTASIGTTSAAAAAAAGGGSSSSSSVSVNCLFAHIRQSTDYLEQYYAQHLGLPLPLVVEQE